MLDLACDRGHFIRFVNARERWATDIRDVVGVPAPDVHFVQAPGSELARVLPTGHFGTVFMSNYLEHLESGEAVIEQLRVARGPAQAGRARRRSSSRTSASSAPATGTSSTTGSPLTERSLLEAAELAGLAHGQARPAVPALLDQGATAERLAPRPPVPLGAAHRGG